jgi:DNA-binding SARP family transcriptional activator
VLRLITLGRLQLIRDGPRSEPIHVQPKRLALLAYLALAARDGFQHRDILLALFWPSSSQHQARRCLRQALFHLRNALGDGVIVSAGKEEIALAADRVWCDAAAVERAVRARRWREARSLYQGDFLPGVFVDDCSSDLEEWVQRKRVHLRAQVTAAAWALVEEELREGRPEAALETARRARALSPDDEHGLRRHMTVLGQLGDRAAALGAYTEFARRLRQEFDAEPSWDTRQLCLALRHDHRPAEAPGCHPAFPSRSKARELHSGATLRGHRRERTRGSAWAAGIGFLVALALAASAHDGGWPRHSPPPARRHLVLAEFTNHTHDSLLGAAVTEALRADLSQIAEVRIDGAQTNPMLPAAPIAGIEELAVVAGDVAALGPGYSVSARLLSAQNGRVLAVLRENAVDSNQLLRAVDRLSRRLRASVTDSLAPALEGPRQRQLSKSDQ